MSSNLYCQHVISCKLTLKMLFEQRRKKGLQGNQSLIFFLCAQFCSPYASLEESIRCWINIALSFLLSFKTSQLLVAYFLDRASGCIQTGKSFVSDKVRLICSGSSPEPHVWFYSIVFRKILLRKLQGYFLGWCDSSTACMHIETQKKHVKSVFSSVKINILTNKDSDPFLC